MTDKEKLREVVRLADAMYYAAQYLTTDASRLRKAMEEYHQFIITEYNKQEPASEDLKQAIDDYTNSNFSECYDGVLISDAYSKELTLLDITPMARYFAQWQKGQMMKDAIEAEIYGVQLILQDGMPKGLSDNDKVKVIIVKDND